MENSCFRCRDNDVECLDFEEWRLLEKSWEVHIIAQDIAACKIRISELCQPIFLYCSKPNHFLGEIKL